MAFDEATHDVLDKVVLLNSEVAKQSMDDVGARCFRRKGTACTVSTDHTMSCHAKVGVQDRDRVFLVNEEFDIPLAQVTDTSAVCIGKAVIDMMERFAMGCPIEDFMERTSFASLILVLVVAHNVGGNAASLRPLLALMRESSKTIVWSHYEQYNLHQVGRITTELCQRCKMSRQLRALFKILQ